MRNPKRIVKICMRLAYVWEKYPDFRFFQLIDFLSNTLKSYDASLEDMFYVEDDKFEELLNNILYNP